jgi:hypothetical protein
VSRAVDVKAVGMNLRAGHGQVNLDQIAGPAVVTAARTFESHVALHDPVAEALQPRAQFARTIFERA